jgi:two-component system phosphate regulon sensor histidine kinase PhoR
LGRGAAWLLAVWCLATVLAAVAGHAPATAALGLGGGLWLLWRRARPNAAERPATQVAPALPGPGPRETLATALAPLQEGVLVLDAGLGVLATNDAARRLLGVDVRPGPTPLPQLVDWPQLAAAIAAAGAARTFEAERTSGDGPRLLAVTVAGAGDGRLVVVLNDQSRLRELESHRREFVDNVSHELKTPLAAIQGLVETLLDDPAVPPETGRHFLQRIAVQVERLATLVSDLLTLSRLDDEQAVGTVAAPCEFTAVVRDALRDLQPLAERKGLRLSAELAAGALWIAAEREALRQIVGNLVDNAIKYTPAEGRVTVRTRERPGEAELEVIDTGIGLSEADQKRVFERFYRVDRARSRELGGTGLGLSIVKNTAHNLGGEVGVQSMLGRGSRFWVRLPIANGAARD